MTPRLGARAQRFFVGHQGTINVVGLIAIGLLTTRFVLRAWVEIVPFGAELGEVVYDLSVAYVMAWIFQWLVVVRPGRARQRAIDRILEPHVSHMTTPGRHLVTALYSSTGQADTGLLPSHAEFLSMCESIDPLQPPSGTPFDDWWSFLEEVQSERLRIRSYLAPYFAVMDEPLLDLIGRESKSAQVLRNLAYRLGMRGAIEGLPVSVAMQGDSLAHFAEELWAWLEAVHALRVYHEQELSAERLPIEVE